MVHKALGFFQIDAVKNLNVTQCPQRTYAQRLRLTAGKQTGAMRTWQQINIAFDRTNFFQFTTVRTHFIMGNQPAYFFLNDVMQDFLHIGKQFRRFYVFLFEMSHRFVVDGINRILTCMLLGNFHGFNQTILGQSANFPVHIFIHFMELHLHLLFAGYFHELFDDGNDILDFIMAEHDRLEHHLFRHFVGFRLHHHDGVFGTGYNHVNVTGFLLSHVRINHELPVNPSNRYAADRPVKRNIGNAQRCRSPNHCRNFRLAVLIHAHDQVYDLHVVTESFREQRANRTVGQAASQNGLFARTSLPFNEATGNFTDCIKFLFIIDRQREKVQVLGLRRGRNRTKHRRISVADHDGRVCLLGQSAGFQNERSSPQIHFHLILHEIPPYHHYKFGTEFIISCFSAIHKMNGCLAIERCPHNKSS
ncbi:hypothetical protein D3C74_251850 [compost metagenome]